MTEAEDGFCMIWYPKQLSTESPKHLWKARMLVRIVKERERRMTKYIERLRLVFVGRITPKIIPDKVSLLPRKD